MRFSDEFTITRGKQDDWFDPTLTADTRLFVDPFLIFEDATRAWDGAHDDLLAFFNHVLQLIAKSGFRHDSAHWKAAERALMFPEPAEFCLGHAEHSVRGAGSAGGLRSAMMDGAVEAIRTGIDAVHHFEELTLFGPGIGVDRISDITCNVLKARFIAYTQNIARSHGVPLRKIGVKNARWSSEYHRWSHEVTELPFNQYGETGVLLTPGRFLREIPVIEASDFWNWSWDNHNEELRGQFSYEIATKVRAKDIVRLAKRHPDYVRTYIEHKEAVGGTPYDFRSDPAFVDADRHGADLARKNPLSKAPSDPGEFLTFIKEIVDRFRHQIEEGDAWRLLWNGVKPRAERDVQALFRAVVVEYCRAWDIDLSGEANAGRGPVDFKFSAGWHARALAEVKLTNNSKFWHGLTKQTPQYMRSEDTACGLFVSVGFRDSDFSAERKDQVKQAARAVSRREQISLEPVFVDARKKKSASKA